ncbi:MAG: hypothetical protein ACI9C1_002283, partial [Candidatus Aldehydirespiratoraceae bacterium]
MITAAIVDRTPVDLSGSGFPVAVVVAAAGFAVVVRCSSVVVPGEVVVDFTLPGG